MVSLFVFGKWHANPKVVYILFCQFPWEGPTSSALFVSFETLLNMPDTQLIDLPSSVCAFLVIPILVYNVGLRVVWLTF